MKFAILAETKSAEEKLVRENRGIARDPNLSLKNEKANKVLAMML